MNVVDLNSSVFGGWGEGGGSKKQKVCASSSLIQCSFFCVIVCKLSIILKAKYLEDIWNLFGGVKLINHWLGNAQKLDLHESMSSSEGAGEANPKLGEKFP